MPELAKTRTRRLIDTIIADLIFNCNVEESCTGLYWIGAFCRCEHKEHTIKTQMQQYPPNPMIPEYSKNMEAVWKLVDKFNNTHYFNFLNFPNSDLYEASFAKIIKDGNETAYENWKNYEHKSPAKAICGAALMCKGLSLKAVEKIIKEQERLDKLSKF